LGTCGLLAADEHAALLQTLVDALRPARLFHGHLYQRYDLTVNVQAGPGGAIAARLEFVGTSSIEPRGRPALKPSRA